MYSNRYVSHGQKRFHSLLIKYAIILVLLIVFMVTIGLKLLINLSLFIAGATGDKTTQTQDNNDLLLPPDIYDIPDATNSATIKISGASASNQPLSLFVNGSKTKDVRLKDGDFETNVDLKKGNNEVYIVIENTKTKEKKESKHYTVVYQNEKPKLNITSPSDGDKVNKNEVIINGETNPDVTITVNDAPVVVDVQNTFSTTVRLNEGDNMIKIKAVDVAGNTGQKELKITYQKDE